MKEASMHEDAESPLMGLLWRSERFLHFLKRLWWIPLLTAVLGIIGQLIFNHFRPPPAVARAHLLVGGKIKIPDGGLYAEEWQNFFGTQEELMKSEKIARRAMDRLQRLKQNRNEQPPRLVVDQTRKTTIFLLEATGKDPVYTVNYLNALMDEYLAYRKEVRSLSSDDTLASLTTQFLEQEKELKRQQEGMMEFQKTNSVALLQEEASSVNLAKLNQELADLKLQRALFGEIKDSADSSAQDQADAKIPLAGLPTDLKPKKALEMLKFQKQELSENLLPDHPKMKKLDDEIARMEKLLNLYDQEDKDHLELAKSSIELKVSNVENAINDWETKMVDANRRLAEYTLLKENLDRVQNLYDHLLHLLQNVGLDKNVDQETVVIMDQAVLIPSQKTAVQKFLASIIGLIVGLAIVGFIATQDDRLTSFKELKLHFPEKVVGQIPNIQAGRPNATLEPLTAHDRRHFFVESYRAMRSSLLFMSRSENRAKSILVTSAMPGEGKSTVTANLARTLAFAGSKVVLVDGDLRTGALHESLGLANGPGLGELRTRGHVLADLAVPTSLPNLHFIPRGTASCDCGELFVCQELDRLFDELSKRFDYILIDSAPVFAAADTLSLAPKVDGTIFVIRDSFTRANLAREALNRLYQLEVRVLGIVLNRATSLIADYYYSNYSKHAERLSFPA